MLKLLTLGGASVVGDSGETSLPGSSQRRTLGLLAALAVAGTRGMSRDKLLALMWPDTDDERGSHALTQALYASRRGLECDDLFLLGNELRLNPARIVSDVADFDAAVASGHHEHALTLYRGAFLDGFYLSGSPGFERWQSNERSRLENAVVDVLERIADRAHRRGDSRGRADSLRRLAALRPLDSGIAVRLMEALALSGDRAGALRYADVHTELLREEFDLDPDEDVAELSRHIRDGNVSRVARGTIWTEMVAAPASPGALSVDNDAVVAPHPRVTEADSPAPEEDTNLGPETIPPISPIPPALERGRSIFLRSPRWQLFGGLIAVAMLLSAIFEARTPRSRSDAIPPRALQAVVIAPFRVSGASASLGYLREGLVELLSTRLASDSIAPSIDAGAVLGAWRTSGFDSVQEVPRDSIIELARRLGAERVVVGSVVGMRGRFVVQATVVRTKDAAIVGTATVEGIADSLTSVVDHLAAKLLLAQAGEDERLVGHSTNSLVALRLFLAGQAAVRQGDYATAFRSYDGALARDSGFALAGLRLALAADQIDDPDRLRRGVAAAWESRDALNANQRALLVALAGPRFPGPSTIAEELGAWQRFVDLSPTSADSWFALGSQLSHDGSLLMVAAAESRARTALARSLVIDPRHAAARRLLTQLRSNSRDSHAGSAFAPLEARDSLNGFTPFLRWRVAIELGDSTELERVREGYDKYGATDLREIALASQYDAVGLGDGARALRVLRNRSSSRRDKLDLLLAEHSLAINEGRVPDALRLTKEIGEAQPGTHQHLRLRVLDALYGSGDSVAGATAASEIARLVDSGPDILSSTSDTRVADICVLAQWRLARSDTIGIGRFLGELRTRTGSRQLPALATTPSVCAELLDASLAVSTHAKDSRGRLARLDSLAVSARVSGDAHVYAPLLVARLHEKLGDYALAFAAVRRRSYMSGWPRYLADMLREEAQLAEITGDTTAMSAANGRYNRLRQRLAHKAPLPH